MNRVSYSHRGGFTALMLIVATLASSGCEQKSQPVSDQKAKELLPPSPLPTEQIRGVAKPLDRNILWTAYYITPVERAEKSDGKSVNYTNQEGKRIRFTMTSGSFKRAEMEGVAVGLDKQGNPHFAYRVEQGEWKELEGDGMGMGNRMNPLSPFRHIAADQSLYPYGSLVHVKAAETAKIGDTSLDGFFWVADTGGMIKNDHFDLFVGKEELYSEFLHHEKRQEKYQTKIYPLPKFPEGINPKTKSGLVKILRSRGHLAATTTEGDPSQEELKAALIAFQEKISYIPKTEHGIASAAVTLWFLTQAALELHGSQK
jgi:3D (Asp-Asp-Asp) domain-containing protein